MADASEIELIGRFRKSHGQIQVGKVPWEKYKWIKFVGKGAFGKVDLYQNIKEKSLVAFKEIDLQGMSGTDKRKAMGEVQVLSMLHHPNIVTYYNSYYETDGRLLIEMEYCENGSLADFLAQQKSHLSEKIILKMFSQIAAALVYLEQKNILHRDMKTANILIARGHKLKVGDFGIAQVLSTRKVDASTVIGTPFSFSPELCEGKRYTNKSDIWAAGCILYEMTCLQRTFVAKNMPALIQKIVTGQMSPIKGNYSVGLRKLIKDLLALQPDLRPTAYELGHNVEELLRNQDNVMDGLVKLSEPSIKLERLTFHGRVLQMSRSNTHTLLVTDNGDVYAFGKGSNGALGLGHVVADIVTAPIQIGLLSNVTKAAAGDDFSLFLTQQGMIYSCGVSSTLCLGSNCGNLVLFEPTALGTLLDVDIADIACSAHHALASTANGVVYGWGHNFSGCLGLSNNIESCLSPSVVDFPYGIKIVKVFASERASMFIDSFGRLWACGDNESNRIGLGQVKNSFVPTLVKSAKKFVISVAINENNSMILLRGSKAQKLGGRLPVGKKRELWDGEILDVKCGKNFSIAMTENEVYFYGIRRHSERNTLERNLEPFTMTGDIVVGSSNYSLMDIVREIGPDYPVIQVRDPKITIETMSDLEAVSICPALGMVAEQISKPQTIVSLYSCQMNKKHSQFVQLSQIYCFPDDSVWIVFDSNLISGESSEIDDKTIIWSNVDGTGSRSVTNIPEWIQKELKDAECPEKKSLSFHSDPTFDRRKDQVTKKLMKKLAEANGEISNLQRQRNDLQLQVSRLQKRFQQGKKCCFIL